MRPTGSPEYRQWLRRLAVERLLEGYEVAEIADMLGVAPFSVRRWWKAYQVRGEAGLAAVLHPGPAPRLSDAQEAQVLQWTERQPRQFGFVTERWTAPRLALLIERNFGVRFHPHYLNAWLRRHHISPQIPASVARERNQAVVDWWLHYRWPQVRKRGSRPRRLSSLPTKAAI